MARTFAAVDLGASSGRVVAGRVAEGCIDLEVVHRFPNGVIEADGHLRWDIKRLIAEVRTGLDLLPEAESIGIDTWGVDYGLLDSDGELLAQPIAYRDDRTAAVIDDGHALIPPEELFAINGLQFLPFTTLYQLLVEQRGAHWDRAAQLALIPDLIAHELTGELRTEATNASTTGLLDIRTGDWSADLLDRLGVPLSLLPAIEAPGSVRGTGPRGIPVVTVGSHDTASAVVGVPATTEHFAYVASGTWSLVGIELPAPVLTPEAMVANFTNEGGVDGRTRFLRNVGGLWLLQESMRVWGTDDVAGLVAEAAALADGGPVIDVDAPVFVPPGDMPQRIADAAGRRDLTPAATARCIIDSLAAAHARTVQQAASLAATPVEVIHVVGGGSANDLLCQRTADLIGLPVVAGPAEATALGNVVVQARTAGALAGSLSDLRAVIAASVEPRRFDPS